MISIYLQPKKRYQEQKPFLSVSPFPPAVILAHPFVSSWAFLAYTCDCVTGKTGGRLWMKTEGEVFKEVAYQSMWYRDPEEAEEEEGESEEEEEAEAEAEEEEEEGKAGPTSRNRSGSSSGAAIDGLYVEYRIPGRLKPYRWTYFRDLMFKTSISPSFDRVDFTLPVIKILSARTLLGCTFSGEKEIEFAHLLPATRGEVIDHCISKRNPSSNIAFGDARLGLPLFKPYHKAWDRKELVVVPIPNGWISEGREPRSSFTDALSDTIPTSFDLLPLGSTLTPLLQKGSFHHQVTLDLKRWPHYTDSDYSPPPQWIFDYAVGMALGTLFKTEELVLLSYESTEQWLLARETKPLGAATAGSGRSQISTTSSQMRQQVPLALLQSRSTLPSSPQPATPPAECTTSQQPTPIARPLSKPSSNQATPTGTTSRTLGKRRQRSPDFVASLPTHRRDSDEYGTGGNVGRDSSGGRRQSLRSSTSQPASLSSTKVPTSTTVKKGRSRTDGLQNRGPEKQQLIQLMRVDEWRSELLE